MLLVCLGAVFAGWLSCFLITCHLFLSILLKTWPNFFWLSVVFLYIGNYSFILYVVFLQSLAEKGGCDLQKITAHPNFFLLATMNPGGDFGKKELSPALRNRFTEIWVPPITELDELNSIALERFVNAKVFIFHQFLKMACLARVINGLVWFDKLRFAAFQTQALVCW